MTDRLLRCPACAYRHHDLVQLVEHLVLVHGWQIQPAIEAARRSGERPVMAPSLRLARLHEALQPLRVGLRPPPTVTA